MAGRQQPIELFMPPNMLKAKVGGGLGGVDMGAMKRAGNAEIGIRRLDRVGCENPDRCAGALCQDAG